MNVTYLGAGCFWGVEELLRRKSGVVSVTSGYSGGELINPTYQDFCTGKTGHAEVVKVKFDEDILSFENLLKYFFELHDPTQLNRQGPDIGTQYRSVIFAVDEEQSTLAKDFIQKINAKNIFGKTIVTEVTPFSTFYPAEEYHQQYYLKKYHGMDGPICHILRDVNWSGI
jgi:methionine-S-sulfoxide reductase